MYLFIQANISSYKMVVTDYIPHFTPASWLAGPSVPRYVNDVQKYKKISLTD